MSRNKRIEVTEDNWADIVSSDPITIERIQYFRIQEQNKLIECLVKALDKACCELDLSNKQLMALDSRFIRMTKEQWKEYLLNERI